MMVGRGSPGRPLFSAKNDKFLKSPHGEQPPKSQKQTQTESIHPNHRGKSKHYTSKLPPIYHIFEILILPLHHHPAINMTQNMTQQNNPPHSQNVSVLWNPNIIGLARIIGRNIANITCLCLLTIIASKGYAKSASDLKSFAHTTTHHTGFSKPPVLSKQYVNWWRHHGSPEPIMGWKGIDSLVKSNIPELNQLLDKQGKLVFLLNLKVSKKGKVDYIEIFDSNLPDTSIHSKLASELRKTLFTPFRSNKGKIINENCLVLMELSALMPSPDSMQNDTLIPNKEIKSARFLGGEDLFLRYVSNEFVYPGRCLDANINGYVLIRFMVDRNGFVSRCQIMEGSSACPEFGKEAIRIFYLCPKWIPATHEGKNINAYFQVPINMRVN
jgi:TonB family protein